MRERDIRFIHYLVATVPALRPVLTEHVEDNFGDVLPHLFLADVLRWLVEQIEGADDSALTEVQLVLRLLEEAFSAGDDRRQELISTGFLENLPRPGETGMAIRQMLGPALRDEADRVA